MALQSDVQPVGHDYVEEVSVGESRLWLRGGGPPDERRCVPGQKRRRQSHPLPLQAVRVQLQRPQRQRDAPEGPPAPAAVQGGSVEPQGAGADAL